MNEFDIKASLWDQNQMHWDRSEAIANEIKRIIPLTRQMSALEYGAGTGITSLILRDDLKEITMMDNSVEMVKIMKQKIKDSDTRNIKVLNFDLEHSDYHEGKFDLIFTQMVLHHVMDTEGILRRFASLTNPGGFIAIADLYEEDGSFHGDGFTGHKGFNPQLLSSLARRQGYQNITHRKCFEINRKISDTETKHFDLFILTGNISPAEQL